MTPTRLLVVAGLGVVLLLGEAVPLLASGPPVKTPAGQPLKGEQLTKEQFDRLPDTQVLDVKGRRMTAGEFRPG